MLDIRILESLNEIKETLNNKLGDNWLNMKKAREYTGVSESTLYRSIRKGSLKVSKVTGRNMFRCSWLDRWMEGS